jgi:pimeloyl-ACP methyl ester carboxylesterase
VGVFPPEPKPTIPPGDDIIIYIHGGPGSRLEEAGDMVEPLQHWGLAKGKRYTVISFDQPSQGYSSMVDPACVVPPHD